MAKKVTSNSGNWTYNKQGQLVQVSTPITADGKPAPYGKTVAGGLGANVGFTGKYKKP